MGRPRLRDDGIRTALQWGSTMFRSAQKGRLLAATTAALLMIACATQESTRPLAPQSSNADLLGLGTLVQKSDTVTTVFTINPSLSASYSIGNGHSLYVRANGVCKLTSAYGLGAWDLPCVPINLPVLVTAKTWFDPGMHPQVEFSPALRFVPVTGAASAVLYLKDKPASQVPSSVIMYCFEKGCMDEGATDPAQATMRDPQLGFVYRRIKHFSGYQVSTGREEGDQNQQ
jgi:hypothetical protein